MPIGWMRARSAMLAVLAAISVGCGPPVAVPAAEAPAAYPAEPAAAAAGGPSTFGFSIRVAFDAATQTRLEALNENVTVSVAFYGEPTAAAAPRYADQTPQVVDLGEEVATIGPQTQVVYLSGAVVNTSLLGDVEGPVKANINIYTARMSGPDNLISCPLIDDAIVALKAAEAASACTLIEP